jgi:hypothetical protein
MKKYTFLRGAFLSAAFLIFFGCSQPSDSGKPDPVKEPPEEDDPVVVITPELIGITVNSTAPAVGIQITAAAQYQSGTGSVTWQWTADNALIEGAASASYTPVLKDFNKTLKVQATPAGKTGGNAQAHTIAARVTTQSNTYPTANRIYSVKDLFKTEADKYYFNSGNSVYMISEDAYNTIKLIFDKNKDNGAIQFFKFPFKAAGELDINNTLNVPAKKIRLIIDDSLTGTRNNPLTVTIPNIPSGYGDIDQLLYYKTPVYLVDSDSGSGANAKYVNIIVENGAYLYIGYDPVEGKQNFKGLIRARAGAVVVDGGDYHGYSAGDSAFYWFDYGSYCWIGPPAATRAPFISTEEPYLFNKQEKPGVFWVPDSPNSFIWVGNNTFLLQGKIKQVQTFSLSAHLKMTPGSEFIIDIHPSAPASGVAKFLLLQGKNIAKWLPSPLEDYYDDLTLGGAITPEPKILVKAGSAIIDYAEPDDTQTASSVADICTPAENLADPPETLWIWEPGTNGPIDMGDRTVSGKWKKAAEPAAP